jgi:ech hydrogenase subunit D
MSEPEVPKTEPQVPELANVTEVTTATLVAQARELAGQKLRFVTASCLDSGEHFEIYYHFEKELTLQHLYLKVKRSEPVPSISGAVWAAFLVENEMKELFGVNITDIAVDYGGRMMTVEDSDPHPMAKAAKPSAN